MSVRIVRLRDKSSWWRFGCRMRAAIAFDMDADSFIHLENPGD